MTGYYDKYKIICKDKTGKQYTKTLEELIEESDLIRPRSLKPKNNFLGEWVEIFEKEKEGKMSPDNVITAKCECGNKVDVNIFDHLGGKEYFSEKYAPNIVKTHEALMGTAICNKCGYIHISKCIEKRKNDRSL